MTALGDVLFTTSLLVPLFTLVVKNYVGYLLGFVLGTVGFLVFVQGYTDIAFSSSTFYLAFLPLAFGLVNFAFFFKWVREERI